MQLNAQVEVTQKGKTIFFVNGVSIERISKKNSEFFLKKTLGYLTNIRIFREGKSKLHRLKNEIYTGVW